MGGFTIWKIELESGADGINDENLITRILDILFLKLDTVAQKTFAQCSRLRAFKRNMINAAAVIPIPLNRAVRKVSIRWISGSSS